RRVMGTRCSGRPSSDSDGGVATGAVGLAAPASAAMASALVMRPSRPVPDTVDGSTPFSERILEAAGDATPLLDGCAAAGAAGAAGAAAGASGAGASSV